jgi:hypothetical protein
MTNLLIGGDGTDHFVGTISKARIYDVELTEDEHDMYHADTLESWWDPTAVWRCDDFCDDTVGHKLWDRTTNLNDLTKGDGSTATTFPTFDTDHYEFDGLTDYLSGFPSLGTSYTLSGVQNATNPKGHPTIQQDNDETFKATLEAAGGFEGWLHSYVFHSETLNQLQLYHDQYKQLYWVSRSWVWGAWHRLITEGVCVYCGIYNKSGALRDWSGNLPGPSVHDITLTSDGIEFGSADSYLEYADNSAVDLNEEITIYVEGDFSSAAATGTIVDKGGNYRFDINLVNLEFNGSTKAKVLSNNTQVAVTCRGLIYEAGKTPRFYVDGEYIGDGSTTEILQTNSTALTVGNSNEHNHRIRQTIYKVGIFNRALTDEEIKALYQQSDIYGSANNMAMNRGQTSATGSGAIAETIVVGDDFDVPLFTLKLSSAPTSAGNITISLDSEAGANYDTVIHTINPVGSTDICVMNELDGFQNGDQVTVAYANPDSRTWYMTANYQQ